MEHIILNKRGQVSVEFMLLIVIVLLYIQTVIQPSLTIAANSVNDSVRVGQARFAAEKLSNAVEFAQSTYGETKQTIKILIPKDSKIECDQDNKKFEMKVTINSDIAACPQPKDISNIPMVNALTGLPIFECDKNFFALENVPIDCSGLSSNPMGNDPTRNTLEELVVKKELVPSGPLAGTYKVAVKSP